MKLEISSATKSAVEYLRDLIITGELKPGQKINETALAADIGLSRPPIREALRILETEKMVATIPRKYTYVLPISQEDFTDLYQVRSMIEGYALELMKLNQVKDFSPLEDSIRKASNTRIKKGASPKEILRCCKIFTDFHFKIVTLTGNDYLQQLYSSITGSLLRYQYLHFSERPTQQLFESHQDILDTIKRLDYDKAKAKLLSHMNYNFELIKNNNKLHIP